MKSLFLLFCIISCGIACAQSPFRLFLSEEFDKLPISTLKQKEATLFAKLQQNKLDKEVMYELAGVYCYLDKTSEAIKLYTELIALYPDEARYYNDMAITKIKLELYAEAIDLFNKAIAKDKSIALLYINRGVTKGVIGDFLGEMTDYNIAIRLDPNHYMVYCNRGAAFYWIRNFNKALDDTNLSIKLRNDFPLTYYNRGLINYEMGNLANAIADFNKAIALKNDFGMPYMGRGIVKFDTGDLKGALADLNIGLKHGADKGQSYNILAQIKMQLGDYAGALKDANTCITENPDPIYLSNRGIIHDRLKNFSAAIADFERALETDPNNARTWSNLANTRYRSADDSGAIAAATMALSLSDTLTDAYVIRGNAKLALEQFGSAIPDFTKAISKEKENPDLYFSRGRCYLNIPKPNYSLAIADFSKAAQLDPNFADAWYNLGFTHYQMDNISKACEYFTKAKALGMDLAIETHGRVCK